MMTPDQFAMMMGQSGLIKAQFDYPEHEPQPAPARRALHGILALRRASAAVLAGVAAALAGAAERVSPAQGAVGLEHEGLLGCVHGAPAVRTSS